MRRKTIKLLQVREAQGESCKSPHAIIAAMAEEAKADRECFWVLHMNTKFQIIEKELVSMGSLNASIAHPREVFKKAILNSDEGIITVHNHPSGDPTPSQEDRATWEKLSAAGEIIGIPVVDNLIITPSGRTYSSETKGEI